MSIRGSALRASTTTQAAQIARPAPSRPSVRAEPQPQTVVSLIATSASDMPALINTAAGQLIRPGTRTGDSGTKRQVQNAAGTISSSGIQNSQCQLRRSTTRPPATMPTPAPTPRIAEIKPIPPATFSRGNSSRMIPNASGKIPPATPWITRATISSASE